MIRRRGRNLAWSGRRFHWALRVLDYTTGPLGIGFRWFFWRPAPTDWSCNLDFLTPLFDLQAGFHRYTEVAPVFFDPRARL